MFDCVCDCSEYEPKKLHKKRCIFMYASAAIFTIQQMQLTGTTSHDATLSLRWQTGMRRNTDNSIGHPHQTV